MSESQPVPSMLPATAVTSDEAVTPEESGAGIAPGTGCPPPLAWTDVLARVREERQPFELTHDGGRITGCTYGEGTPLYFLGGETSTPEIFSLVAYLLRDRFRCVFFNYQDRPSGLDALGRLVPAVADHLGDEQVDVFGTSFGALVALQAAATSPERVRRIVVQAPLLQLQLSLAERMATSLMKWLPLRMSRMPLLARVMQNNHGLWFPPIDETRWQFLVLDTARVTMPVVARRMKLLHRVEFASQLADIRQDVLVVSSEGDSSRHRASANMLTSQLTQVQSETISNSGLVPYVTHPHRVATLIRNFLQPEQG